MESTQDEGWKRSGNNAIVVLAVIACAVVLHWGAPFFIPLFLSLMIAYTLSPVTDALMRLVKSRVLAATMVMLALLALLGAGAWAWSDDAVALWQRVPEAAKTISASVQRAAQNPSSPVSEVKKAAAEIESIAQTGQPSKRAAPSAPAPSQVSFWQLLWSGGKGVMVAVMQFVSVMFLVFFMLASGDTFKRKLVRLYGGTLSQAKITVQVIDEIDLQIRRYLGVVVVSNVLVGIGTWVAFRLLGVNYPELWGLAAGVIHTAPYFGPAVIAVGAFLAAFMQFGSWGQAALVSGVTIVVATLVGSVFATWLSARQTRMNTTATFVGLLFFGWIWGLWGILLGIPLLAIVKSICDHTGQWRHVSELLGREEHPAKRLPEPEEKTSAPAAPDVGANP